ncbi:MAG: Wzt carbohydrate-binding domain-containing protein, partial [Bryobacteraceae bacterium]
LDPLARARATFELSQLRRGGATIFLATHDLDWLLPLSDEVWWLSEGQLMARGDPVVTLDAFRTHVAGKLRAWGETLSGPLATRMRRGDGRAEVVSVETTGSSGKPTLVWSSGEAVEVRVTVHFKQEVEDPVIGMLIRSRIGLDVYGTNTELEGLPLGPCPADKTVRVTFRFFCDLCPQEYTITIASHDPDGTRHDWLEEAIAVSVTDSRYTAGVANLRARVSVG